MTVANIVRVGTCRGILEVCKKDAWDKAGPIGRANLTHQAIYGHDFEHGCGHDPRECDERSLADDNVDLGQWLRRVRVTMDMLCASMREQTLREFSRGG